MAEAAGRLAGSSKVISYEEVKKLVAEGAAQIFDVRSPEEVAKGKIASAVHIPERCCPERRGKPAASVVLKKRKVAEVEEAFKMDLETFKMKYGVNKPQPDDDNLVFHCQIGKRGARATEIAVTLGYAKARNYAGGYREWSEKEGK
ncbi:thiosulfate:glutathione sulfurtransferase isoform X2 [Paroedura picta]|uniref:thiosulfate:glutathione sulfurtransferase isoform X2 n=1 Tax=Paroedura picta TaxID=143630 RepID=UPI004055B606